MRFPAVLLPIALALTGVNFPANALKTFTGNNCDGKGTFELGCLVAGCVSFAEQNSLQDTVQGTGPHCLKYYSDSNCGAFVGQTRSQGDYDCVTVNFGTKILSVTCGGGC